MTDWLGLEPGEMWRLPGWFGGLLLGVAISWWRWRRPR